MSIMKNSVLIAFLTIFIISTNAQTTSSTITSSSSLSVAVSSTNDIYSYSARFDRPKTKDAKSAIINFLGEPSEETKRATSWKGKGYNVRLSKGKVEMKMHKSEVVKSFQLKFENMGDKISESIGSPKTPTPPKPR